VNREELESLRDLATRVVEELGARLDSGQLDGAGALYHDAVELHACAVALRFTCQDRLEDLAGEGEA
jgi:hypothetical protein